MAQLVQLQERVGKLFQERDASVVVIFREEDDGQDGLKKVVEHTKTNFVLALDTDAAQTRRYSPGHRVHNSYIIDSEGTIRAILDGTRYDRAHADEFVTALNELTE